MDEGRCMCTTAAKWVEDSWCLIKTRDPVSWMRWDDEIRLFDTPDDTYKKMIVQNPDFRQDGYYGGINEKGVSYVSTFVRVSDNGVSYIRRPYVRLILDAATAREAVEIIKAFIPRIGGNMLVADKQECFGIEGAPDEYFVEEIKIGEIGVKTNHFHHLQHKNLAFEAIPTLEAWSKTHHARAHELVLKAQSMEDMREVLRDRKYAGDKNAICTTSKEEACFTHSAMVFDTTNARVWYAQGNPLNTEFKAYNFSTKIPEKFDSKKQSD